MTAVFLAASLLRMSLVLAAGLLVAQLLRRRTASLRAAVLATSVLGALAVVPLTVLLPSWHLPALTVGVRSQEPAAPRPVARAVSTETTFAVAGPSVAADSVQAADHRATPTLTAVAGVVWFAGVLVAALMLAVGLLRLAAVERGGRRVTSGAWFEHLREMAATDARLGAVTLLQTEHPTLLVTAGLRRPRIVLPRGAEAWDLSRIRLVLEHEAEHIRRRDWVLLLAAEALRALAWFNPLAWTAASQLRLEAERACDDAVLRSGVAPAAYATQLVDLARTLARPSLWIPAPAMARVSSLERRVSAMLDERTTRNPLTQFARMAIVTAGCAAVVFVATIAAQSSFATFGGVVRDQLGGTIPNATVSVTHTVSGAKHELKSNERGQFEFVGLVAGTYAVAAAPPGFKGYADSVQLAAGQTANRELRLTVGSLQETITIAADRPAGTTRSARAVTLDMPACTTAPNSGGIRPPRKVADTRPVYPASMRSTGIEGRVELRTLIGLDGMVKEVQTTAATNADFELAAIEAVRQWRFTQTLLNCVPIEVEMNVLSTFRPEGTVPAPPPPPPPPPPPQPVRPPA